MPAATSNNYDRFDLPVRTLFIDDGDICDQTGLKRVVHPSTKHAGNPVLWAEMPWEDQRVLLGGSVLKGPDGLRMWYQGQIKGPESAPKSGGIVNLYAESKDGVNWTRPNLGQWEFNGSTANNLYAPMGARRSGFRGPMGGRWDHNQSVMYTPQLGENRRFTMLSRIYGRGVIPYAGSGVAFSRDGIDWVDGPDEPVIPGWGDVTWFMYDDVANKFRGTLKTALNVRGWSRRTPMYTVGSDLYNWGLPKPPFLHDEQDDAWTEGHADRYTQFYGMPMVRYESVTLGLLEIFRCYDGAKSTDGFLDVQLGVMREGGKWERVGDRTPVIQLGGEGTWDAAIIQTGSSLVVDGDVVRVYFTGSRYRHGDKGKRNNETWQAIGMATWPRDRMVGMRAGNPGGEIVLRQKVQGRALHINADALGGEVVVEVANPRGTPIGGFEAAKCVPLRESSLDHTVLWEGSWPITGLAGTEVEIRIKMQNAEVFSLWWE